MLSLKQTIRRVLGGFGVEAVRQSRSPVIARLTGARNILNHPGPASGADIERLGQASLLVQLESLLSAFEIDCVIDVGANTGQFAALIREHGYRGQIVSFEPMAACAAVLESKRSADPAWSVHRFGLGSQSGEASLNHFSDATLCSLYSASENARAEFGPLAAPTGSERITLRPLDEVWDELVSPHAKRGVLLKIDTQGHDLEVLRGALKHLPHCSVILCEASFSALYQSAQNYHELFGFLEQNGFACAGIHTLCMSSLQPKLVEADALFINTRIASISPKSTTS